MKQIAQLPVGRSVVRQMWLYATNISRISSHGELSVLIASQLNITASVMFRVYTTSQLWGHVARERKKVRNMSSSMNCFIPSSVCLVIRKGRLIWFDHVKVWILCRCCMVVRVTLICIVAKLKYHMSSENIRFNVTWTVVLHCFVLWPSIK